MLSWQEIVIRLLLASFFGALIGIERERKHWTAGLRTHMMVCLGSCLIMMISAFGFSDVLGTPNVNLDPSRIAAQVVSGIGFIGAGTILFIRPGTIHGLTTAAGMWTVAAIGLATGAGMYFAAGVTTGIALIILWALQPIERRILWRLKPKVLNIKINALEINPGLIEKIINNSELNLLNFQLEKTGDVIDIQLKFNGNEDAAIERLIDQLGKEPTIKEVSWNNAPN